MAVPVMKVGIMWMPMHHRLVSVPMRVWFAWWHIRPMGMLVMFVMNMTMFMFHCFVAVLVLVAFCQV